MDLAQLESFLAIARLRSFTLAARDLHLTQPGVSRQLQRLEREIGAALFERTRGALQLTAAGRRTLVFAEEVVEAHRRMIADISEGRAQDVAGELRIAASTTPGEFLVPGLLAKFTGMNTGVRPQVFIADSAIVAAELLERRWDVGFMGMRTNTTGLNYDVIAEDEVVLAVPRSHPFASRPEVALAELEDQPFVEREHGSGTLRSVEATLAALGLALPKHRVVMVLGTTHAIVSAVQAGYGIGWVSSRALQDIGDNRAAGVRLAGIPIRRPLYLVTEKRRLLPPPADAFVQWIRAQRNARAVGGSGPGS